MSNRVSTASRPLDLVIGRLQREGCEPQATGAGVWRSRCPVHRGSSPCLSIKEGEDGTVLLKCHHADGNGRGTCGAKEIAEALDLELQDLFPGGSSPAKVRRKKDRPATTPVAPIGRGDGNGQAEPKAPLKAHRSPEEAIRFLVKKLGKATAYWVYNDPDGFELMRVYRFDPPGKKKTCRPVCPDADGWRVGDPPGKLPLYHLDQLAAAQVVVIPEGEKCADLALSLGLTATTSAHGAKSAAKTDWSPMAGKTVIILPDHEDGEGYAADVTELLHALEPRPEIRILRLPLTEVGDDIEQWLDSLPDSWTRDDRRTELERLWSAVPPWSPPPPPPEPPPKTVIPNEEGFNLTEWGNAQRLIRTYGDRLRYCHSRNIWLAWDGRRWDPAKKAQIWEWTKETIRQLVIEAIECEDTSLGVRTFKWALESQRKKIMAATIDLAWSEPGIGVIADDFDRDPWLLNCPNGTVDLRTGELRPHRREDLISKITLCDYDPTATCPRWRDALKTSFAGDEQLITYVQRAVGYSLTGDVSLQVLFLCFGKGRNGKNTILDTMRIIAHDYATVAPPRIFLAAGQNEHPVALADLVGRRFIPTSEVDQGERLAESLVKRLTGDRTIKARFMHQNPFEFLVTFKLWMLANARPKIHGRDEGIWSRIKLIPFDVFIPPEKRIRNLCDILVSEEGPGILGWAVQGNVDRMRHGLEEPDRVRAATEAYRLEQDAIGEFLAECCESFLDHEELRNTARVRPPDLYARYMDWCNESREKEILSRREFGSEMTDRGYPLKGSNSVQYRFGLKLKEKEASTNDKSEATREPY